MDRSGDMRNILKEIHTSKYFIAYIDFLGSSEAMFADDSDKFLNDLNNIVYDIVEDFKGPFADNDLFIKVFSDNLLFGFKCFDDENQNYKKLEEIINIAIEIQNKALDNGYLIRGAITKGDFFINERFVYGEALVRVVKMEEKQAGSPRIIATEDVVKILHQYFCPNKDENGNYTLNNYIPIRKACNFHPYMLLEKLKKDKNNEKAKEKDLLAIQHYNYCVGLGGDLYAPLYEIITQDKIIKTLMPNIN